MRRSSPPGRGLCMGPALAAAHPRWYLVVDGNHMRFPSASFLERDITSRHIVSGQRRRVPRSANENYLADLLGGHSNLLARRCLGTDYLAACAHMTTYLAQAARPMALPASPWCVHRVGSGEKCGVKRSRKWKSRSLRLREGVILAYWAPCP